MPRYNSLEDEEDAFEPFEAETRVRRGTGPVGARETFRFVEDPKTKALTILDEEGRDMQLINPLEVPRDRYARERLFLFQFGVHGTRYVLVWSLSIEEALEEAAGWLDDQGFKGHFVDEAEMKELYEEAKEDLGEDADEDDIYQQATADLTYTESGYLASHEWFVDEPVDGGLFDAARYVSELEYNEEYGED